ncbi:MAG: hypothetical protein IJZ79_03640 [Bacilli bacterium]|nr:hypothetical protein [Bacilli bacterium]MBQ8218822.1 hypothetical protein [Bacilli bacterium]
MSMNTTNKINRWKLTNEIRNKIKPILEEYFHKVENLTVEQVETMSNEELGLNLSDLGINPYQLTELLKEFGYEKTNSDHNGWELDFWIHMRRSDGKCFDSTCERIVIAGCGMTFELKIYIEEIDC